MYIFYQETFKLNDKEKREVQRIELSSSKT